MGAESIERVQPAPAYACASETPTLTDVRWHRPEPGWPSPVPGYLPGPLIKAGGMGAVYEARHEATGRRVAVKFLSARCTYPFQQLRFAREISALRALHHENTVRIQAWGDSLGGHPYFVMDYVNGMSLSELVAREGPQTLERTLSLLQQICASIGEAHDLGMAHRDLKPHNVMLSLRGQARDWIRVVDFGLVKLPRRFDAGDITSPGSVFGTPGYAPPEAWTGAQAIAERGDVYGIALIGHHLLTGRPPLEPEELLGKGTGRLLAELKQVAPRWFCNVLGRCLHTNPERRFADANRLGRALARRRRVLAGQLSSLFELGLS
jgi:serine/threonine protein kinase